MIQIAPVDLLGRLRERWDEARRSRDLQLGWDDFPPELTAASTDDEIYDYLGRCRLRSVVVEAADRTVAVTLEDPAGAVWRFLFAEADVFCETSRERADQVGGDLGIWSLEASPAFLHGGRSVRLFLLEGNVPVSIYAGALTIDQRT